MAAPNLFEDLKKELTDFKGFLDANVSKIKPAVSALMGLGVPIDDLLNQLVTLMGQLKTGVQGLDVANIPGLAEASAFTAGVHDLLTTAKSLLPDASDEIDAVLGIADVVKSLPSLDQIKGEIISLIDAIVNHLNSLKA